MEGINKEWKEQLTMKQHWKKLRERIRRAKAREEGFDKITVEMLKALLG